jgi:flagellar hook-basal body complex protein FliE
MASEIELKLISPAHNLERAERNIATGSAGAAGFSRDLSSALESIDRLQVAADQQADAVANGAGNLHEVALAFEKADVALRLASRVRNKLIDAYNEIMRMSV